MEKKKRGCLVPTIIVLSLLGWWIVLRIAGVLPLEKSDTPEMGVDERPDFEEIWSEGSGKTEVVMIPLRGPIFLGEKESLFSEAGSADIALQSIRRATQKENVKAIFLVLDSGGGGITASDIIYQALLDFKAKDPERKIVALFEDVSASGAYYIAMAADYIIAHPTTITGSIGVLVQSLNLQGLAEKIGVRDVTIKSGENKDMLNPLKDMTPEQYLMIQELVDEFHSRFVSKVALGRNLPEESVRELANGRIYSASQALDLHLVDGIGYHEQAVQKICLLLEAEDVKILRYEKTFSLHSLFQESQSWNPVSRFLQDAPAPRLLYMWRL